MTARAAPLRRTSALTLIISALVLLTANAQVRVVRRGDERLKGISSVDVVVTGLDAGTAACGLDKPSLLRESARRLNSPGLRATISERASSWFYTLTVDVRSTLTAGRCATAVATDLIAHVDGIPEADRHGPPEEWGSLLVGGITLIHDLAVVQSDRAGHATAVAASLAKQISSIGERIRLANRLAEP